MGYKYAVFIVSHVKSSHRFLTRKHILQENILGLRYVRLAVKLIQKVGGKVVEKVGKSS